jgi:hypothetical protein
MIGRRFAADLSKGVITASAVINLELLERFGTARECVTRRTNRRRYAADES